MDTADKYFIDHLHLLYNKPNLIRMNGQEGSSFKDAFKHKSIRENLNEKEIETIIERLRQMFQECAGQEVYGGGRSLKQLKDFIREKVKKIEPR